MAKDALRILVSRHSAFYSPLIATIAASFLAREGLEATYAVLPKGRHARHMIRDGEVDVVQAAVSSNWLPLEQGESDLPVHFAQINQRDGFFLAGQKPDPAFRWKKLEGASLVADHAGQPLAMLKYAAHSSGVDWNKIECIDAGEPDQIDAAFRAGRGNYVHLQGPAPQQLEKEGIGSVVAAVGEAMPAVAFSSVMASREFLSTDGARSFLRAYTESRAWVQQAPAEEVAATEAPFFPGIDGKALAAAIARYQALGCWLGELEITREHYQQSLTVFLHSGAISRSHRYEEVVVPPPIG